MPVSRILTWITHLTALICCLSGCDEANDYPDVYQLDSWKIYTTANGLSSNRVLSLKSDDKGNLWAGTLDQGIMKYDGSGWSYYQTDDGIGSNTILCIEEATNDEMWFGTLAGFTVFDGISFINYTYQGESFPINDIFRDSDQHMWLATSSKGLMKLEGLDQVTIYRIGSDPATDTVLCIEEDGVGNIWAGSHGGVFKISGENMVYWQPGDGIPLSPVSSILSDSWGNIWMGSVGDQHIIRYDGTTFEPISLHNTKMVNLVFDIVQDDGGNIWFGLGEAGAVRFNGSQMETYREVDGLSGKTIFSIEPDREGKVWFGTYRNGISVYTPGPKNIIPIIH